jgi:hypothetical protein
MAELKTKESSARVAVCLSAVEDSQRRRDAKKVAAMMREATGSRAKIWGTSIIGFGSYHYRYASGREGDWMLSGLSPRKQNLTLYIMAGFREFGTLMSRLGPHKIGKPCLYIKRLADIDLKVLESLIK